MVKLATVQDEGKFVIVLPCSILQLTSYNQSSAMQFTNVWYDILDYRLSIAFLIIMIQSSEKILKVHTCCETITYLGL